jgi:hypothetical protein
MYQLKTKFGCRLNENEHHPLCVSFEALLCSVPKAGEHIMKEPASFRAVAASGVNQCGAEVFTIILDTGK